MLMDFKQDSFMMILGGAVVAVVLAQSVVFLIKSLKRAKELGIPSETVKNTVFGSALFTVAPAAAVVATVLALSGALGIAIPWIRLSVIGSIAQETAAAQATLDSLGTGTLASEVTDTHSFTVIAWAMTIASSLPLVLLPLLLKKIQKKLRGSVSKRDPKWADAMSAAAFIGLISAFIARAVLGQGKADVFGDGAGVMSAAALLSSSLAMVLLSRLCRLEKLKRLSAFAMPVSMFIGMGAAVLCALWLPGELAFLEWRG